MAEEKIGEALPVTRHMKIHCEVGNCTCCTNFNYSTKNKSKKKRKATEGFQFKQFKKLSSSAIL